MAIPATPNRGRRIIRYPIADAETYVEGAPVVLVAGEITECAADPTEVLGLAATPATLEFDPYGGDGLVYVAYPDATFLMQGSTDPLPSHVGNVYGIGVDGDGVAFLDIADVTNLVLQVENIYIVGDGPGGIFEVSFVGAVRQLQQTLAES
jgi:hypothetical protein